MGQRPEGKRRAAAQSADALSAAPAEIARMWAAASAAHTVLGKRRLYFLATEAEERMAEQLSLVPLLQDWVSVSSDEATELTRALRAYSGSDIETLRDREAEALRYCVRAMTVYRARSSVPFPPEGEDLGGALIG